MGGGGGDSGREQFELKGEAKRRVLRVEISMDHPQGGNQLVPSRSWEYPWGTNDRLGGRGGH